MNRKFSTLNRYGKSPVSVLKREIQALLRECALVRDGGCVFREKSIGGKPHICSGWRNDGEIVYQYDHLNPREKNASYANLDLGVIICKGLHLWKKYNKEEYDAAVKKLIGTRRAKLWDRVKDDHKSHNMGQWEWSKEVIALKAKLVELSQ